MWYKRSDDRAIQPRRAHPYDAGLDLFALEDVHVRPGEVLRVRTGIHIANYPTSVALYWDKSGRASHGLTILGGCIDGPYRGELEIVVANVNIRSTLDFLQFQIENLVEHRSIPLDRYEFMLQKVVTATVTVPYGKALTQVLVVNSVINESDDAVHDQIPGLDFPELNELSPNQFDELFGKTLRGEKGFSSSDQ